MKYFARILKLMTVTAILVACGRSDNNQKSVPANIPAKDSLQIADTRPKSPKDTLDTIYTHKDYHYISMKIKHGDRIVEVRRYDLARDTSFHKNGKPESILETLTTELPEQVRKNFEYYSNGQLKSVWQTADVFGCGNRVGEQLDYDSLGNLKTRSTFKHDLPKHAIGCHDTHTVISITEYHPNGKVKLKKQEETCYECDSCDCGTWEYYNKQGKLIKKVKHENCDDGLSCND